MSRLERKGTILISTILFLIAFSFTVPIVNGNPGSSMDTATSAYNGISDELIPAGMLNAYYNISGQIGDFITINLTYAAPTYQFNLYLKDQVGANVINDTNPDGSQSIQFVLISKFPYCIHLYRSGGDAGDALVTIAISGLTAPAIPGFELILSFFSIVGILALLNIFKRHKFS